MYFHSICLKKHNKRTKQNNPLDFKTSFDLFHCPSTTFLLASEKNTNDHTPRLRREFPEILAAQNTLIEIQYFSMSSNPSFVWPMSSSSTRVSAREAAISRSFFFFISSNLSCSFLFCISFLAASLKWKSCLLITYDV